MKQFHDKTGASWAINITLGNAKRVYNAIGVDLLNPLAKSSNDTPVSQRLLYDDLFLLDVVTALVDEQLKKEGISADDFSDRIDGAVFQNIENAFWEEYRFFFEDRGKKWMAKAIEMDIITKKTNEEEAKKQLDSIGEKSVESPVEPASQITNE